MLYILVLLSIVAAATDIPSYPNNTGKFFYLDMNKGVGTE